MTQTVLAGDVGGTHTRLALFDVPGDGGRSIRPRLVARRDYPSLDFEGPEAPLHRFIEETDRRPAAACLAVACPVSGQRCRFPNLDWELDAGQLRERVDLPRLTLVNDFEAVGHGIPLLRENELATLQEGRAVEGAPVAVLGPGTGLGHAWITGSGRDRRVHASEGGHMDFAPRTAREADVLARLRERHEHVSWERVVSGPGLRSLYSVLGDRRGVTEVPEAAEISRRARTGEDPTASEALELFVSLLGAQAGNVALLLRAEGGVHLAGGIPPKILDALRAGPFLEAFRAKGRMRALLETIPVRVVLNEDVGLLGAAEVARATLVHATGGSDTR